MKRGLILIAVLMAAVANGGQEREAYPGQSSHATPPKGWYCTTDKRAAKDHQCDCHRECGTDDAGKKTPAPEDPKCTVWCHKDHCGCPVKCGET